MPLAVDYPRQMEAALRGCPGVQGIRVTAFRAGRSEDYLVRVHLALGLSPPQAWERISAVYDVIDREFAAVRDRTSVLRDSR